MSDTIPVTVSDSNIFSDRGYSFHRLLGEGSYAKVWLVKYRTYDNDGFTKEYSLACKIIDTKKAPRDFVHKFLPREMDILTKISHPHLIHLHSIYQRRNKFFIFMRFAERGDLLDHILAHGEVKEKQARLWIHQLTLGLQYLHCLEIVHRDIKCENVLISSNNNVKLADFGFARFIVDATGKKLMSATYCGSLAYAAPELLKGKPYDPKCSDVWSLGVVLFVMLNQCMPFNDNDMRKLYELQMSSKWSFRSKVRFLISEEVKSLIESMLVPDANNRITTDGILEHKWFTYEEGLRNMTVREREALESGLSKRSGFLPKTGRLSMPSWKKRKKDDQIVCVTSMRFERSSNLFSFDPATRRPEMADKQFKTPTENETTNPSDSQNFKTDVKVKLTTSSLAIHETYMSKVDKFIKEVKSPEEKSSTMLPVQVDENDDEEIFRIHEEIEEKISTPDKPVNEVNDFSSYETSNKEEPATT